MAGEPSSFTAETIPPVNRHALSATEKQRAQLDRLLKDPAKPAYVPQAPQEKTIRPAREMMKNVQGSSAGAGSGEFHVYKASRRREYERLKLLEEQNRKETETAEFERKRKAIEEQAEAKTAKNRAKRQKKKERTKKGGVGADGEGKADAPLKKRRLVNGQALVFKRPGEEDSDDDAMDDQPAPELALPESLPAEEVPEVPRVAEENRLTIHEDD
ncbi:hypothetical protein BD626DRAFT_422343 [Schizophyllum amplum]|uniref:DUF1168 domain protein n=1 Tax=Schizophyllum amplum TaxID=97359 RepID=A0A550CYN6_9AGAR|nr:hypothetical protein BD626DRAFT_422343 [Auriculariopsis ampla]